MVSVVLATAIISVSRHMPVLCRNERAKNDAVFTVVPECHKDDVESQWKNLKFDAPPSENA